MESNNLSITQFLNLSKLAGSKLEAANPVAKERICRMLFLNLAVNEEKVVDLQIREPYAKLLKMKKISIGRGDRARTCDLTAPSRTRYQLRYTPLQLALSAVTATIYIKTRSTIESNYFIMAGAPI